MATTSAARRRIRAVTFDLDDTLWDTMEVINAAVDKFHSKINELAPAVEARFGRQAFAAEMNKTRAYLPEIAHDYSEMRRRTLARCAAEAGVDDAAIPALVDSAFEAFIARRCQPVLFPAALPALKALRERGLLLGAITNGNADLQRLPALGELLGFCVSSAEAGAAKPAPAAFDLAAQRLAVPAGDIVHVGDNYDADVHGAKAAGYGFAVMVQAAWEGGNGDEFPEADAVVRDMSQIVAAIDRLSADEQS